MVLTAKKTKMPVYIPVGSLLDFISRPNVGYKGIWRGLLWFGFLDLGLGSWSVIGHRHSGVNMRFRSNASWGRARSRHSRRFDFGIFIL